MNERQITIFLLFAFGTGAALADDADIGLQLKDKGGQVVASKGLITSVTFQDAAKLTDEDFRRLTGLTHLQTLSLSNGLNDARFAQLAGLSRLETLQTNLAQITDDGIKPLARLKSLRNLKFFHPGKEFTGAGLVHLAGLPNLERLTVAGSLAFNDDGMAAVARLANLKEFRTWHAGPTLTGVKQLAALKNLKSLHLGQRLTYKPPACPDDATIAVLAQMKSLETLIIDEARLTLPALRQLKQLPNLKKLTLGGIEIPGADVELLKRDLPAVNIEWTEPNPVYQKRIRALFGS